MKMSTPHDVPTHMLDNPDQYITKVGKISAVHIVWMNYADLGYFYWEYECYRTETGSLESGYSDSRA